MKMERTGFTPIVLTLESQSEVDAIFAFLNHSRISESAGIPENDESYRNEANCNAIHKKWSEMLKKDK